MKNIAFSDFRRYNCRDMKTIGYKQFLKETFLEKARLHDLPAAGCFELTPLCNLDCRMCYVHLNDPAVRERILSGEQWIALMEQAIRSGMVDAVLTGGEAMTHPDFWQIYMYLIDQGVSIHLKTNGILLTGETVERLLEYPPFSIDVSLYGCDGESYKAVTGHNVFETVSGNVRTALAAGLPLGLAITPSAYMLPWIDRVLETAAGFGTSVLLNGLLAEPKPETGRSLDEFRIDAEENARIRRRSRELLSSGRLSTEEQEERELLGSAESRPHVSPRGLHCNGGRTGFVVWWTGAMGPCPNFPRDILCAEPLRTGFEAAWHEVNQGVKDYAVPEACHSCAVNTRCHYCPARHGHYAVQHACDPAVCAYWKSVCGDRTDCET